MNKYRILFDDPAIRRIDEELRSDLEEEKIRKRRFSMDFPGISSIPVAGSIIKCCYSVGFSHLAVLFVILGLFTAIKAPYFGFPFTGDHAMKYSAYVEPAFHMAQKNDATWYQLKYQSDPAKNPDGVFSKFRHLPIFEWGLYAMYKFFPYGSIETKTRIYTHFIGLMIMIFGHFFFRNWVPANLSLLIVFLMAINPIVIFSTFVTVLDSLAILIMFLSFILLNQYFDSKRISRLFWAGVVFGIGIATKYSMFLWVAPISLMLIYYMSRDKVYFLRDYGIYLVLASLFVVTFHTSIRNLPTTPVSSIFIVFLWVGVFTILNIIISRYEAIMYNITKFIFTSRIIIAVTTVFVSMIMVYFWKYMNFSDMSDDFLTDSSLLLNHKLYQYMLRIQFKEYMTPNMFWLAIVGIVMILLTKENKFKKLTVSFLFGSVIYCIIASKVMFFHNYYTIIIMILFCLSGSFVIYYLLVNIQGGKGKAFILILFSLLIFPPAYRSNIDRLNMKEDISEINDYIIHNTNEGDIIVNELPYSTIAIYTSRSLIYTFRLVDDKTFRDDIMQKGFSNTMRKYRVKYLITESEKPSYIDFAPLFAETKIRRPRWDRRLIIFNTIDKKQCVGNEDVQELQEIVQEYKIYDKFHLEAKVGKFRFFTFVN